MTFFPMHIAGLMGMPSRVYTYPENMGWDWLNLLSTGGSIHDCRGRSACVLSISLQTFASPWQDNAGNVWRAGTLEWLPNDVFGTRSIPIGIEPRALVGRAETRRRQWRPAAISCPAR